MENKLQPMIEQESVEDLIKQLRDTRFSNEKTRKDFIHIIARLASAPDKSARLVIKKIGDYMSSLGDEIINKSSSTMPDPEVNDAEIIDMDKEPEKEDIDAYNARRKAEVEDSRVGKYAQRFIY